MINFNFSLDFLSRLQTSVDAGRSAINHLWNLIRNWFLTYTFFYIEIMTFSSGHVLLGTNLR